MICNLTKTSKKENYVRLLSTLCREKQISKELEMNALNKKIKHTWDTSYNIDKIIDFDLGAIFFPDYEWENIKINPFKQLFSEKYQDSTYKYLLDTNNGKILRGCDCYYFIASYKNRLEHISSNLILNWLNNIKIFLNKSLIPLQNKIILSPINRKFILAILDHLRMLATIMSIFNINKPNNGNSYFKIFDNLDELFKVKYVKELNNSINLYLNLFLENKFSKLKLVNLIKTLLNFLNEDESVIRNLKNDKLLSTSFKIHREADCLIENYISIKNGITLLKKENRFNLKTEFLLIGLMNGAVELPILANIIMKNKNNKYGYFSDTRTYLERYNSSTPKIQQSRVFDENVIIFDDNIMSGKSIQNLINISKLKHQYNIILIRHPNINRVEQVFDQKYCVNLKELKKIGYGMLFDSPYSKIKENTNYNGEYLDELGVFTLTGDNFLKLLYKNGHYTKNSEVSTIKGLL